MSQSERTVSSITAALVVAVGLALIVLGQGWNNPTTDCDHVDQLDPTQVERVIDYLVTEGARTGQLPEMTQETLSDVTGVDVPSEALPCLRNRAQEAIDDRVS